MDLYNGEIIAHHMARRPLFELVTHTLRTAVTRHKCTAGLVVHSDQGWQYKMQPYREALARAGITQNMSRKGDGFDNAVIESAESNDNNSLSKLAKAVLPPHVRKKYEKFRRTPVRFLVDSKSSTLHNPGNFLRNGL